MNFNTINAFARAHEKHDTREHPDYWRKEPPEMEPLTDQQRISLLRQALEGLREMAHMEWTNGSNAWRKAVEEIDQVLEDTEPPKMSANQYLVMKIRESAQMEHSKVSNETLGICGMSLCRKPATHVHEPKPGTEVHLCDEHRKES